MNLKQILILLIFLIAIIGIIAPASASLEPSLELQSAKTIKGKTKLYITVNSDIGNKNKKTFYSSKQYTSKRKNELNTVKKAVISIKGHKPVTIKKPAKGWKKSDRNFLYFDKTFKVKGKASKINNKKYTINLYNMNNKLIKNKKGRVLSEHVLSEKGANKNPKKFYAKLQSKNKKNYVLFQSQALKKLKPITNPTGKMIATSSGSAYYYNKNSDFKREEVTTNTYYKRMWYSVKKKEATKNYTNGEYTVYTSTYRSLGRWCKQVELYKDINKTSYKTIKNPYFTISKECNWTHPLIMSVANSIKANITRSNYSSDDVYNMELANAVIRYLHLNIKYDYTFSKDQTALTTLKRGSGTCYGNTLLAGALLRAVGIPVYFETQYTKKEVNFTGYNSEGGLTGHIWPVTYIFYDNKYNWVPAETTTYYGNVKNYEYYLKLPEYFYPFHYGATDWWINYGGMVLFYKGYGNYSH